MTALIDCGTTKNFINPSLVQCLLLPSQPIPPLQAFNIDGTINKQGQITAATKVHCKATTFEDNLTLMIIGLGWAQLVLGMPWLTKNNPCIDWVKKTISFNKEHIRKTTLSTELAITARKDKVVLPPQYADYACYNPFSSLFHFALYSFLLFTYLERKTPFLHKYFLSFDLHFFFLLFPQSLYGHS